MQNKRQKQNVSENSIAIQAGKDVNINYGLTVADVRQIVLSVYKENFIKLSEEAASIAIQRVEEITEKFLIRLRDENPEGLQKANDPDFQYSLYTIQKEYARSGDKNLGDLLVDLLIDRSKQDNRNILQIVLSESLNTAPKLTENQLAALSVIFILRYSKFLKINDHSSLGEYFDKFIYPFQSKLVKNMTCYQHLEYSGCGSIQSMGTDLARILFNKYQGLFLKGFQKDILDKKEISEKNKSIYFIPCINDPVKMQVSAINKSALENNYKDNNIGQDEQKEINQLFDLGKMNNREVENKCKEIRPYIAALFDLWSNSMINKFSLTSVGMAIGHANVKRSLGEFSDLSIWIN